jgi:hypothetical protein
VFGFDYQGFGNSEGRRNRHRALEQAQNCYDRFEFRNPVMSQTTYRETIAWFRQYL